VRKISYLLFAFIVTVFNSALGVLVNQPPNTPTIPLQNNVNGINGEDYSFTAKTTDPDGDNVKYSFDWGDGQTTDTGMYGSGQTGTASHIWQTPGTYLIKAKATDSNGAASGWSSSYTFTVNNRSDDVIVDIMVVYTAQARQGIGGTDAMNAKIDINIEFLNHSLANSLVNERFRLVHTAELTYTESGDMALDLQRLTNKTDGFMDEVHTLRDQYGADLVSLLVETGQYGGIAWVMINVSPSFQSHGFSVTKRHYTSAFSHECGHNMGCSHDRANGAGGAYPYSYGYNFFGDSGTKWGSVMSYPGFRVRFWSNPNVTFDGKPFGIDHSVSPNNSADNAKTLGNTATTVSGEKT